jgi:DNA-binding transcriptional MerR regulator
MPEIQADKLYSLEFTADTLCVSKQTLRNWDNNGSFKSNRTKGKHRRYLGKDILEKLQKGD